MPEIEPTPETVFTQEYWEAPAMPEYRSKKLIGRARESWKMTHLAPDYFSKETLAEAEEMLLFAANLLVARESVTAIDPGEQIGGPDDITHAIPDAVLLIDRETVRIRSLNTDVQQQGEDILQEHELGMSTLSAFMSGMTRTRFGEPRPTPEERGLSPIQKLIEKTILPNDEGPPPNNYAVLNPFNKHLNDPEHGTYSRVIDLFAFAPNKKGDTASIRMEQWRNPPAGPHVVTGLYDSRWLHPVGFYYPGAVGETLNVTVNPKIPHYTRIRETRLCLPGSLEHAKAPAKAKHGTAKSSQLAVDKA